MAISKRNPKLAYKPALCWVTQFEKAQQGGPRSPLVLRANLKTMGFDASHVVLIDDVATSGGHLKACARALRNHGHTVELALCAGRTTNFRKADVWEVAPEDLEADPFAGVAIDI